MPVHPPVITIINAILLQHIPDTLLRLRPYHLPSIGRINKIFWIRWILIILSRSALFIKILSWKLTDPLWKLLQNPIHPAGFTLLQRPLNLLQIMLQNLPFLQQVPLSGQLSHQFRFPSDPPPPRLCVLIIVNPPVLLQSLQPSRRQHFQFPPDRPQSIQMLLLHSRQ